MSKNVAAIIGAIVFLVSLFIPFMGLGVRQGDMLPVLMSLIGIVVALGLMVYAINEKWLKRYIYTVCVVGITLFISSIMILMNSSKPVSAKSNTITEAERVQSSESVPLSDKDN